MGSSSSKPTAPKPNNTINSNFVVIKCNKNMKNKISNMNTDDTLNIAERSIVADRSNIFNNKQSVMFNDNESNELIQFQSISKKNNFFNNVKFNPKSYIDNTKFDFINTIQEDDLELSLIDNKLDNNNYLTKNKIKEPKTDNPQRG